MPDQKHRIFILGASGFLGYAIYKELAPYFKTYGTYFSETLLQLIEYGQNLKKYFNIHLVLKLHS